MGQIKEVYVPGNCNIGPAEIKRRYRIGYLGLFLMVVFIILAEVFQIPQLMKLFLFAPTFYALSGFLQARQRFCFLFGLVGISSLTGKRSRVNNQEQKQKDRQKAIWLILQIFIGSLVITLLYYGLTA